MFSVFVRALGTEATTSTTAARFSITLSTTSHTHQPSLPFCCQFSGRKLTWHETTVTFNNLCTMFLNQMIPWNLNLLQIRLIAATVSTSVTTWADKVELRALVLYCPFTTTSQRHSAIKHGKRQPYPITCSELTFH